MPKSLGERVPYSAIVDRPKLTLPGNARLAVWVIVNVENWEIRRPMPRMVLPPPLGGSAIAGPSELGVARIRHARRLLALSRMPDAPQYRADAGAQRIGLSAISARLRSCGRRRVGVYGAWLRPNADAQPGRPAWRDPPNRRGDHRLYGAFAARLGKPWPHRDPRYRRSASGGRHRIRRRLGA